MFKKGVEKKNVNAQTKVTKKLHLLPEESILRENVINRPQLK